MGTFSCQLSTTWEMSSSEVTTGVSALTDGAFAVSEVGGGTTELFVFVETKLALGPNSKFPENPRAKPAIQTAASARLQMSMFPLGLDFFTALTCFTLGNFISTFDRSVL